MKAIKATRGTVLAAVIAVGVVLGSGVAANAAANAQYVGTNGCGGTYSAVLNTSSNSGGSGVSYNDTYGNAKTFTFSSGNHQTIMGNKVGKWSAGATSWNSTPYSGCVN